MLPDGTSQWNDALWVGAGCASLLLIAFIVALLLSVRPGGEE